MKRNPKVILLGESNVGKTSILHVLMHGLFQEKLANTLGACFHRYECKTEEGTTTLDLWDTAGQQKYRSLLTLYYKNCDVVLIVFDVTDTRSFQTVAYWSQQLDINCSHLPCVILVGNKIDVRENATAAVTQETVMNYLENKPGWRYLACSAKSGQNIEGIFKLAVRMVKAQIQSKEKKEITHKNEQNRKMKLRTSGESKSCC